MPPAFAVPKTFRRPNIIARILEAERMKEESKWVVKNIHTIYNTT
jgi:hypothetical protein